MKPPVLLFEPAAGARTLPFLGARKSLAGTVGALLALLAFAALAHAGWNLARAQARQGELQARIRVLQAVALPVAGRTAAADPQRVRAWNAVARQLNTPWAELLDTLESATPPDVALVSVAPDAAQGAVRLQAEAKSLQALLGYERALRMAPLLRDVVLVRHETNETDAQRPVRLHLLLRLRAAEGTTR